MFIFVSKLDFESNYYPDVGYYTLKALDYYHVKLSLLLLLNILLLS